MIINCNSDQSQTIINEVCHQLHNREQQFTFNWFYQLSDDIELIYSLVNTGKTLLLVIFISTYHKLKAYIIITVSLNAVADILLQQLIIINPESKPEHIYQNIFKNEESHYLTQPFATDFEAAYVIIEISIIYQIKIEQHLKIFSLSEHSLIWMIMKHTTNALNDLTEYV